MNPAIVAIQIGPVEVRQYGGSRVVTAAHKRPVQSVILTASGCEGDEQADRRHHGGPEKAVCVYPAEHYQFWQETWGVVWEFGAFGENLTLAGVREKDVCIGDVLRVGDATVQVSQPRQPCSKLAARHNRPDLIEAIRENGNSGYYLRVLEEGLVRIGDACDFVSRDPAALTVRFANRVMHRQLKDRESLDRLLAVPALSESWRDTLSKRL
jgi:MOSC domain-containing protein YiiM